jgi:hypothetical protein
LTGPVSAAQSFARAQSRLPLIGFYETQQRRANSVANIGSRVLALCFRTSLPQRHRSHTKKPLKTSKPQRADEGRTDAESEPAVQWLGCYASAGEQIPISDMPLKMVISPDKKMLVAASGGFNDTGLTLFEMAGKRVSQFLPLPEVWNGLAFSKMDADFCVGW